MTKLSAEIPGTNLGSDLSLARMARDMMKATGMETKVQVGETAFKVTDDEENIQSQHSNQHLLGFGKGRTLFPILVHYCMGKAMRVFRICSGKDQF